MDTLSYKTKAANKETVHKEWVVIDAHDKVLGRLSSEVARLLRGKHKKDFTPHVDCGDYVIVTNAQKIVMTGRKLEQKKRMRFSGYPGGLKAETYGSLLKRRPTVLIEESVRRMLPKSKLGRQMLSKLKVYAGPDHPHQAQQPIGLDD
ncbi:MAG: 50S ribosomal protein L13 [Bacteroidetes bacterium]|nr:50S ribosomal protein L13 [Bacteroidota bacterium]